MGCFRFLIAHLDRMFGLFLASERPAKRFVTHLSPCRNLGKNHSIMKEDQKDGNEPMSAMPTGALSNPNPPAKLDFPVYNEADLVSFGNYLLDRYGVKVKVPGGNIDADVTDAALQNWKDSRISAITPGMKLMGWDFNPSKNPHVDAVKYFAAKMYDYMQLAVRGKYNSVLFGQILERASTEILAAQMMAVKAITWKD